MAEGLLSLCWNNHRSTFCQVISSLREKERYCDATLACEGKIFPVHQLVLSVCSDYLDAILASTAPCSHPVIVLRDVRPDDLEALLTYMYDGIVSVAQQDIPRLIKVAEMLKIKGLAVSVDSNNSLKPLTTVDGSNETTDLHNQISSPQLKRRKKDDGIDGSLYLSSVPKVSEAQVKATSLPNVNTIQVVVEENPLVKEELNESKEGLAYGMVVNGQVSDSQSSQPLAQAVAEALGGPSGIQTWLTSGGFTAVETFTTESNEPSITNLTNVATSEPVCSRPGITPDPTLNRPNPPQTTPANCLSCPYCLRSTFRQGSDLKRHIRTHTGEKPYKCAVCPYRASRKDLLLTHTNKMHQRVQS